MRSKGTSKHDCDIKTRSTLKWVLVHSPVFLGRPDRLAAGHHFLTIRLAADRIC